MALYHYPLMLAREIPDLIDPFRFARLQRVVDGVLPISKLNSLKGLPIIPEGFLEVTANFGIDAQGIFYIKGEIIFNLKLECQRCLQALPCVLSTTFAISPIKDEKESEKLPSYYEAFLLEEDKISFKRLVEEELILNLPLVPKHSETEDCRLEANIDLSGKANVKAVNVSNPFTVLQNLIN